MRIHIILLAAAVALAACGGGDDARDDGDEQPEQPTRTFADDTIAVKDKAQQRTEAAIEQHREQLQQRLDEDEAAPAAPSDGDEPRE